MSLLKKMWKNSLKHKKLSEDWSEKLSDSLTEPSNEKRFRLKYVGVFPAEIANSPTVTTKTVELAILDSKSGKKKMKIVDLTVSQKGICVEDINTFEKMLDISIYRISYCSADGVHGRVFAFIALGSNDILECHVFLCQNRKLARSVSEAAGQTFKTAHETWKLNQQQLMYIEEKTIRKVVPEVPEESPVLIDFGSFDCPTSAHTLDPFEEELWAPIPDKSHLSLAFS